MKSTHFSTGFASNGLTIRSRKCNDFKNSTSSCSSFRRVKVCNFLAVSDGRQLLNNAGVGGDCRLFAKNTATFSPLITHRRKSRFPVVGNQSNSEPVLGSADVDETLAVEQEDPLRNSDNGTV